MKHARTLSHTHAHTHALLHLHTAWHARTRAQNSTEAGNSDAGLHWHPNPPTRACAIPHFPQSDPSTYVAIFYQTAMKGRPADQQTYSLVPRKGTEGFEPTGVSAGAC